MARGPKTSCQSALNGRCKQTAGMNIVYRLYEGVGYAVTGALSPPALMKLADRIYPADAD